MSTRTTGWRSGPRHGRITDRASGAGAPGPMAPGGPTTMLMPISSCRLQPQDIGSRGPHGHGVQQPAYQGRQPEGPWATGNGNQRASGSYGTVTIEARRPRKSKGHGKRQYGTLVGTVWLYGTVTSGPLDHGNQRAPGPREMTIWYIGTVRSYGTVTSGPLGHGNQRAPGPRICRRQLECPCTVPMMYDNQSAPGLRYVKQESSEEDISHRFHVIIVTMETGKIKFSEFCKYQKAPFQ